MLNRLLLFVMAACLGTLFLKMELPIPYLLGGIFAAVACKIAGSPVTWPKNWRELGLLVAGYGIGRNFTADTWEKMTHQTFGVLEATLIAVAVAVLIAWWTARHTSANLISCVMGIMPGGLTQMMLMSEDDPRADANVVVVMQHSEAGRRYCSSTISGNPWFRCSGYAKQCYCSDNRRYALAYSCPIVVFRRFCCD